jgi:CubicO group peptidase (beta-lactamase class C family)
MPSLIGMKSPFKYPPNIIDPIFSELSKSHEVSMRSISFIANSFLLVLIVVANVHPSSNAQEQTSDIATKLAEICRKHNVPAMSAAVVNAKGLVKSDRFGVRKRGTSDKVDLSDRFPLGSNTKSMTAVLAAVMVETGKIEWETTISDVWPKAKDADIHPKLRKVTLGQLLSHQSGLPANISDISAPAWASFFDEKQTPTLERQRMLKLVISCQSMRPSSLPPIGQLFT